MVIKNQFILSLALSSKKEVGQRHEFPFNLNPVQQIEKLKFNSQVTFLVGENGGGKSTIIEAIAMAVGFPSEGGSLNSRFSTVANSSSELHECLRVVKGHRRAKTGFFLRAESFFNFCSYIESIGYADAYGGDLHKMSHGEGFISLMLNKMIPGGLYIMDEPEAALSPVRQLTAIRKIYELSRAGSQFIIATHSPILTAIPNASIYEVSKNGIEEKEYEATDAFVITKDFLNNYDERCRRLIADDD